MKLKKHILYRVYIDIPLSFVTISTATAYSSIQRLCSIAPGVLVGVTIDTIVNNGNPSVAWFGIYNPTHQFYLVIACMGLCWFGDALFDYMQNRCWYQLAQEVEQVLRTKLYAHIHDQDLAFIEQKTPPRLTSIVYDDVNHLKDFIHECLHKIIQLGVSTVCIGGLFLYFFPQLALTALLPIPLLVGLAYFFRNRLATLAHIVTACSTQVASHLAHSLSALPIIKSYTAQDDEQKRLEQKSKQLRAAALHMHTVHSAYTPVIRVFIASGVITVLIVGGIHTFRGLLPVGWYATLVLLTQNFLWPFTDLPTITELYRRAVAAAYQVHYIMTTWPTIVDGHHDVNFAAEQSTVRFENVSIISSRGIPHLHQVSCVIPAQTIAAFVGPAEQEKKSLVHLLLRFRDPDQGTVMLNTYPLSTLKICVVRSAIALLGQPVYLIPATVAENITYGSPHASYEDMLAAAIKSRAHDFIIQLPKGYKTLLTEKEPQLSPGQQRRLAVARALVKNAPIFIFDETTTIVDNETEAVLQDIVTMLAPEHTIIIVAHQLALARHAQTIFVLNEGAIIESGSHPQLIHAKGLYAQLWQLETGKE